MRPYHTDGNIALYDGDLRNVLPGLPGACVDYVVTDPPYGLSFMGEGWDSAVPGPDYWRSIARVCKPGALLAAFGGTRTWHRLVCAIEDAGWEIRDTLMWLQGQGFPKSADVGKLIDKAKGAQREVVGDKLDRPGYHLHEGKGNGCYGGGNGLHAPGTDARLAPRDHGPGHRVGRGVDRLGLRPEACLGTDHPGHEAPGRHDRPQRRDVGRGGHEHRRLPHRRQPRLQVQRGS